MKQQIDDLHSSSSASPGGSDLRGDRMRGPFPLTSPQREVWFDQVLHGEVPLYNIGAYETFVGEIDPRVFERAVNLLVRKHDCLRTILVEGDRDGGVPLQALVEDMPVDVPLHDFSGEADPRAAALDWLNEQIEVPFALYGARLFHYALLKLAPDCFYWHHRYHHIIIDGWTGALLSRSLGAIYTALVNREEVDLTAPSYAALVRDDRAYFGSERYERDRAYWLKKYPHPPEPLFRPRGRDRASGRMAPSDLKTLPVPRAVYDRLIALAQNNQSSVYHVLLAVLYAYVVRTSGRDQVVMGLPVLNRPSTVFKQTAGLCVGVSAIEFRFGADLSFRELLAAIGQTLRRDYRYQRFPISELNREVVLRQIGRQQLFDLRVSYERHDGDITFGPAKRTDVVMLFNRHEQTPLTLFVREFQNSRDVRLEFVYNSAFFDAADIQALTDRFSRALQFVADVEDAPVSAIPVLTPAESERLERWTLTPVDRSQDETVVGMFARHAAQAPQRVAVELDGQSLTYRELDERANRLAHHLIERHGVGCETLVATCVERSLDLVVGWLGILKAGAAYVPLDPGYPVERLSFMLEDCRARVVLTQARVRDRLSECPAALVVLDEERTWSHVASSPPAAPSASEHLAYVIYTSGSTGKPKGVMVEHRSLANLVGWHRMAFGLDEAQRSSCVASVAFDAATWEVWPPLCTGATLVVAPPHVGRDPDALLTWWQAQELDVSFLPTPIADMAFARGLSNPRLRTLLVGGDRLRHRPAQPPALRLVNNYGPTEATVVATSGAIDDSDDVLHIGRPIANTRVYILDAHGARVPIGAAGEMYIGGVAVTRGYLNRPELNAERFLPDPFADRPGARMYKTGDLARYLADGNIEFLGRNDAQVKIRGVRIELGEIEARLREHPGVRDAVVLTREDSAGAARLVAYVTPAAVSREEAVSASREQIAEWSTLYDREYGTERSAAEASGTEAGFDIVGWNSSYTRSPIPAGEMREWLDGAVARIRGLQPTRILELGAGTGMVLFNVVPHCEHYVGTDLSRRAIAQLGAQVSARSELRQKVQLIQAEAADFQRIPALEYDLVVLNSVVQYFPSIHYLEEVIAQSMRTIGARGHVFVGDVRHHGLLEAFHLSVQLHQASADLPLAQLASRVSHKVRAEPELLVHPAWFRSLRRRFPQITRVDIMPKEASSQNELSAYRYDVILAVGSDPPAAFDVHWIDCTQIEEWSRIEERVERASEPVVGLWNVANPRVHGDAVALELLRKATCGPNAGALRACMSADRRPGATCAEVAAFCREHGYGVTFSWLPSDGRGRYHALIGKDGAAYSFEGARPAGVEAPGTEPASLANDPLLAKRMAQLPAQLRAHLASALPESMLPSATVVLDSLPLTPNGKIDRRALLACDATVSDPSRYEAPVGETETALAQLWAELLMRERVGRQDHFFELGGHSLLAVHLIERMRRLGMHADMSALFFAPTLRELAGAVRRESAGLDVPANRIPAGCQTITSEMLPLVQLRDEEIGRVVRGVPGGASNVQDIYPLTPPQHGILLHHLASTSGDPYVLGAQLGFDTRARLDACLAALQVVVERHDILRTAVMWEGLPEPVQVVWRKADLRIEEVELEPAGGDAVQQLADRFDARRCRLDLRHAPLMRAAVTHDRARRRWVLSLLFHHVVVDHTTLAEVLREIRALLDGRAAELPAPLPYRDFVARAQLGPTEGEHERFFRAMLADVDAPTTPFGLSDIFGDGSGVVEARRPVDASLARRLREQARALGVTAASVCHVAWAQVLARITGGDDVVFGTVLLGRMSGGAGADRVLGMLINTLPIRIRVGEEGAEDTVRRVHLLLAELLRHEHASLVLAQRCSGVPAPQPLFSTLLNYRHSGEAAPGPVEALAGWPGVELLRAEDRTNYPITLSIDDRGEGFELSSQAPSAVSPERMCAFMHAALDALVGALESAPSSRLRSLDVMPAGERQRLLVEWNATPAEQPRDVCIHELFERRAAAQAGAIAVTHDAGELTYGELNARANRLAHHLRSTGVQPDARVALCVERSLDMVIGLLAILKAGGAYVPLDPAYPLERLAYMLEDSAPTLVLTHAAVPEPVRCGLRAAADERCARWIDLQADAWQWSDAPSHDPGRGASGPSPAHLAYVIYTSGSTGRPKGVMVEHANVVRLFSSTEPWFQFGPSDVWTAVHSVAFDFSVWEIWGALVHGSRLVVVPQATTRSPEDLYRLVCRERVTVLNQTPSAFRQLVVAQSRSEEEHQLRCVIFGGEALDVASLEPWYRHARNQRAKLVNMYGITETTVHVTYRPLEPADTQTRGASPIGWRIPDLRLYVLDSSQRPMPIGAVGEIYVGGAGVARGYLNRPELTAERFMRDPFVGEPGARMYKTGDLGRQLADGSLEYWGRNDSQIKIRGFRVELGEIEAALAQHAAVGDAVVVAREGDAGDTQLVAYYTRADAPAAGAADDTIERASSRNRHAVDAEQLRAHLSATLPEYMVPAAYVELDALPLTVNGKLNRAALPAPDAAAYCARGYEAPVGELETTLARLWGEVLQVARVGRRDDFFALGGHSLSALRLVWKVGEALGVEVSPHALFAHPVLAELAQVVAGAAPAELPPIARVERSGRLALSYAQQRLWFLSQFEGVSRAYHIAGGVRLAGELDVAALRRALDRVVARHEALRTTFVVEDGGPVQRIAREDCGFHLVEHDLTDSRDPSVELARLSALEAEAAFDLSEGPLIRGRLARMSEVEHVLLVTMHHIVADGWSLGVLLRELGALYGAYRAGGAEPLAPLPIQYADWAAWQRQWLASGVLQEQLRYWEQTLAGAPALLELPTDRPRPAQPDSAGAVVAFALEAELTQALAALGQRHGATLFMTVLAGWAAVLARLGHAEEVVIGTPVANRSRAELEPLIGFFVNTLALRVDVSRQPSGGELLERVKQQVLAAQQHQDVPFERVVEAVKPARSLGHSPVFQVMLAWQDAAATQLALPGLTLMEVQAAPPESTKFDLTLTLGEQGSRLVGGLEYATALFDRATVERHLGYLRTTLTAMVEDEQQQLARVPLLGADEWQQVVHAWNATEAAYPQDRCVHELFEARAAAQPSAPAVEAGARAVTYRELNARANQLARHLRGLGVGPDVLVGVCLERSVEMVVALVAILKAGGAYVPLDPSYPPERLQSILVDCAPRVVLTDGASDGRLRAASGDLGLAVLDVQADAWRWADESRENLARVATGLAPAHLAYVIYTSGSTGVPKGVLIEHRSLVNHTAWQAAALALTEQDAVLQRTSISFDASVWELWTPLAVGARMVLLAPEAEKDAGAIARTIQQAGVTVAQFVPSLLGLVLAQVPAGQRLGCRYICSGGEPLASHLATAAAAHATEGVVNLYGPTEATIDACAHRYAGECDSAGVPIGRPIANTRIYLLDEHQQPVPRGAVGEIHIGGVGVARGYLNQPALTAERFLRDPFASEAEARMYQTGDLGRHRPDGTIEFVGRTDFQVKLRGHRIELGEIESRLRAHPALADAVVVARGEGAGDRRLVAYFTRRRGTNVTAVRPTHREPNGDAAAVTPEELRLHLAAGLPEYMLPSAYVELAALPLSANGKLNRAALPPPDAAAYCTRRYEAPVGEIEDALARIWGELLGLERVGRHDHFFELGGHSLLAVTLLERMRQESLHADVRSLFAAPTLAALAATATRIKELAL